MTHFYSLLLLYMWCWESVITHRPLPQAALSSDRPNSAAGVRFREEEVLGGKVWYMNHIRKYRQAGFDLLGFCFGVMKHDLITVREHEKYIITKNQETEI